MLKNYTFFFKKRISSNYLSEKEGYNKKSYPEE